VPGSFVPFRRLIDGRSAPAPRESSQAAELLLRFQLPPEVLPLTVERARLAAKLDARGRRVTVAGLADKTAVELYRTDSPLEPLRVDVTDERLLKLDAGGGLHLRVTIGEPAVAAGARNDPTTPGANWAIDYLELEVTGRTAAAPPAAAP
jgi:hypothetical protein